MSATHPGVEIRGGAGSTRAHLEDLERCAAVLRRAAEQLTSAAWTLRQLEVILEECGLWAPAGVLPARQATQPLRSALTGVAASSQHATRTADDLTRTAALYRETDSTVARLVRARALRTAHAVGEAGPAGVVLIGGALLTGASLLHHLVWWRLVARTPTVPGLVLRSTGVLARRLDGPAGVVGWALGGTGALPDLPDSRWLEPGVELGAAFVVGAMPGRHPLVLAPGATSPLDVDPVPQAALHLSAAGAATAGLLGRPPSTLVVTPVVGPPRPSRPPRDVAEVVEGINRSYPSSSGDPGTVEVQRLDHTDGTTTWVVSVPGTQSGDVLGGPDPADMTSNLQLMARRRADVADQVVQAMERAGVAPDEPVLLAGHSQGGITAVTLAGDPAVQERFTISALVTVGSPVGHLPTPTGVDAVHLEIATDPVPATDGRPNPESPHRVTVRIDPWASTDPEVRAAAVSPLTAHGVATYARAARDLPWVDDPSLAAFGRSAAGVLGDGTATVTTSSFTGMRVPVDAGPVGHR